MSGSVAPLLSELHAHTTFSDGELTPAELVDLYGAAGFDVLAITDHVCRADHLCCGARSVSAPDHGRYLAVVEAEAERARRVYGLLVIPGLELTYEDEDPRRSAHALAVGLRSWVGVDGGVDSALETARAAGAALIAAHPYTLQATRTAPRTTARFAEEREWARGAVDRFELCNRHDFFAWVAEERLPVVATGDFHRLEHLATWKTLLPCAKDEDSVVDYLRAGQEVSLVRLDPAAAGARRPAKAA
jgi:predicted metal-dependent phosphoesterase TrpH